jgi:hypothetical protein
MTDTTSTVVPGTPTLSSGYTTRLAEDAVRCDQARLLARLQSVTGSPCQPQPTPGPGAAWASILELDASRGCPPPASVQLQTFPKVAVPESIRIQRLIQQNELCSTNPFNPNARFSQYVRFIPTPCPVTPMPTIPRPTFRPGCTPSRFF